MRKSPASLIIGLAIGISTSFNVISAQADPVTMTLTPAGSALFTESTFADGFPTTGFCCGPLGIAFPTSGGVMVSDYPGNVRVFATDADGQNATAGVIGANYGSTNGVGLSKSGGNIYMTEQGAGQLIQLNNNGTLNHVVATGLPAATGITTNPNTGHLYVSTLGNNVIYDVNPTTGVKTPFVFASADGLTINTAGTTLYGEVGGHILGWSTATGLQVFDSGAIANGPDGVAIGATGSLAGKLFVNTNGGTVVEVDITSLTQTLIATGGTRGDFVTVDPNNSVLLTQTDDIVRLTPISGCLEGSCGATPLPATLPLFATGLGAMGLFGWRRKRKNAAAIAAA